MPDQPGNKNERDNRDAAVKPEPETLHTPDPQKKMEGPVSSFMHKAGETFDTHTSKKEADAEKDADK